MKELAIKATTTPLSLSLSLSLSLCIYIITSVFGQQANMKLTTNANVKIFMFICKTKYFVNVLFTSSVVQRMKSPVYEHNSQIHEYTKTKQTCSSTVQ